MKVGENLKEDWWTNLHLFSVLIIFLFF